MSNKSEQLKRLIETMVRKEVRAIVPQVVREVMAGMILEGASASAPAPTGLDNSEKRRRLMEASGTADGYEEYPTLNRANLAAALGYGDFGAPNAPAARRNMVFEGHTENGTAVPVDASKLPDHVVNALTRNYSDVMKALEKRKNNG